MTVAKHLEAGFCRCLVRAASRLLGVVLCGIAVSLSAPDPASASGAKAHSRHSHHAAKKPAAKKARQAVLPTMRAAILVDADTGVALHEANADAPLYPASLTKMMTLYLTFAALNRGSLDLDQRLAVSRHAAVQEPTKLWLKAGDSVLVRNLILAVITRSANDAAVVLAEGIAGSEAAFARRMTAMARRLGMNATVFRNASGLPDPAQRTTARDLARLALALQQHFPREFDYFSVRQFKFRGQTITGHNHLLEAYEGTDGIKTGYTRASGFNLVASVERDGRRLIGVILGSPSWQVRDRQMVSLLDRGFSEDGASRVAAQDRLLPSPAAGSRAAGMARLAILASPVSKAEAATMPAPKVRRAVGRLGDRSRSIQLGAFRARTKARAFATAASRLALAKHKTVRVVKLVRGKGQKGVLYGVRLSAYAEHEAKSVCASLKRKLPCRVLPKGDER